MVSFLLREEFKELIEFSSDQEVVEYLRILMNHQINNGIDPKSIISIQTFTAKMKNFGLKDISPKNIKHWINIREINQKDIEIREVRKNENQYKKDRQKEANQEAQAEMGGDGGDQSKPILNSSNKEPNAYRECYTSSPPSPPKSDTASRNSPKEGDNIYLKIRAIIKIDQFKASDNITRSTVNVGNTGVFPEFDALRLIEEGKAELVL